MRCARPPATVSSRREGRVSWPVSTAATVFGFSLWWECALVPGVPISTSPFAPRTHWDQIYLPVLEPLALTPGDELALEIVSETGGGESGIDVIWTVEHSRSGELRARQTLDLRAGFVG